MDAKISLPNWTGARTGARTGAGASNLRYRYSPRNKSDSKRNGQINANQPKDVQVVSLHLHVSTDQLIKNFKPEEISAGVGIYDIPVATLRDGVYHIGIKTNKGVEETISLLVRNFGL